VLNSLKARMPSDFTIEAGEAAGVWVFDRVVLADLCAEWPPIMLFSRRLVSRMLMESEESNNLFKMYTPQERYHYIEKNNPALLQRVPLSQIASYLGVARETLSRIRSKK
jgi:CRP-like cAMP-binding protein